MAGGGAAETFNMVINAGLKLSMVLHRFAGPLGSAGEGVKDLGTEVVLFCAIMRQVRPALEQPKSCRIFTTVGNDVHNVLTRGNLLFVKIQALLSSLKTVVNGQLTSS